MSITVLNLTEASTLLRTINRRDIKDVRAIDLDLALVLENGHKIIISRGAVAAVNSPQLVLEFADGDVILGEVFEKLNHIEVPPDAAITVTSKEIKRYGIKRVVKPKQAAKDNSEEQADAKPETEDGKPVDALADDGALKQPADMGGMAQKSGLTASSLNDAGNDKAGQAGSGGVSWPLVAGGLGLLAAAAGGGGGGGGGAGSGSTGNAATPAKPPATLSGATALGPLNNATITAYDSQGNVIGKPVQVVNGRYSLVLEQSDYKGLILLAVRDNTPGVADNFADEATLRVADLGTTVLRSVVLADGSNQTINVTALTELAVLKAGLASGQTNLAASQIGAPIVAAANAAVSALFKVNVSRAAVGDVVALFEGNTVLARKVLTSADVGAGNKTVSLSVAQSLAAGEHDIVTRYTDTAGNTVTGATQHVSVAAGSNPVTLTELSVRGSTQAPAAAQALNASETGYAAVNDLDTTQASGHAASGPVISGKVGGGNASDRYVVTIEMGGKVLAFGEVSAGDFSVTLPAGALAPGLYRDLTVTASRSDGAALGQSAVVQGLKLGWYWAAQSAGDILGGNGNDEIALGSTRFSTATIVQTGAGQDKIIVGSYGRTENLSATVSDFTVGVDKVAVFNQTITQANLSSFVRASAGADPNDTRLIIDLDGAGPGALSYTLMLQNVVYNNLNTASIFGL